MMPDNPWPKISIVTASLNSFETIETTIQSVVSHDYPNIEYIIIDGGSTDGTVDIIKKYQSDLAYWISEPDQGISDAFNKGIQRATGEIVGIVSADDYLPDGVLQIVAKTCGKHGDADVIYGNSISYDSDNRLRWVVKPEKDFQTILRYHPLKHSATYIMRSAYSKFGMYDTRYRCAMDYELVVRFYVAGARFVYVDEILGAFQSGGANDRDFIRTITEVRDISISYGYSPYRAYLLFYGKVLRLSIRKLLLHLHAFPLIRLYRKMSPRFDAIKD